MFVFSLFLFIEIVLGQETIQSRMSLACVAGLVYTSLRNPIRWLHGMNIHVSNDNKRTRNGDDALCTNKIWVNAEWCDDLVYREFSVYNMYSHKLCATLLFLCYNIALNATFGQTLNGTSKFQSKSDWGSWEIKALLK